MDAGDADLGDPSTNGSRTSLIDASHPASPHAHTDEDAPDREQGRHDRARPAARRARRATPSARVGTDRATRRSPQTSRRAARLRPPHIRLTPPDPVLAAITAVAVLPIVVAVVVGIAGSWSPIGDQARLAMRATDLLRGHLRLTGIPSGTRFVDGLASRQPGPMEVWVLAIPTGLLGSVGMLVTVGVVNIASAATAIAVAWRRGGRTLATGVAALVAVLSWSLGPSILRDPLPTHVTLLPLLALALLCWDVRLGRHRSLLGVALFACWVGQTHALHAAVAAIMVMGTLVLAAFDPVEAPDPERSRSLAWAAAIVALLFVPVFVDQFAGSGNLGDLRRIGTASGFGFGPALRLVVRSIGLPPAILRSRSGPLLAIERPLTLDWLAALGTVALLGWSWSDRRRASDRQGRGLVELAALGLFAAVVVAAGIPAHGAVLAADALFVLWPLTGMVWLAIGWSVFQAARRRRGSSVSVRPARARSGRVRPKVAIPRPAAEVAAMAVAVVLVILAAAAPQRYGGFGEDLVAPIARLEAPIESATAGQHVIVVHAEGQAAEAYARPAVANWLTDEGKEVVRSEIGTAPDAQIWLVSGPDQGSQPAARSRLIALVELMPGGPQGAMATRWHGLQESIAWTPGAVRLRNGDRVTADDWAKGAGVSRSSIEGSQLGVEEFLQLWSAGLLASPSPEAARVREVRDDHRGREGAGDDVVISVWYRAGGA